MYKYQHLSSYPVVVKRALENREPHKYHQQQQRKVMAMTISSTTAGAAYEACSRFAKTRSQPLSFLCSSKTSFNSSSSTSVLVTKCRVKEESSSGGGGVDGKERILKVGSPIIVIEAPKMLKTAASVPCLRANPGLVNPGDVGRIVSRKPKDVWAVRLSIGTYLLDGKYFKPLELDDDE